MPIYEYVCRKGHEFEEMQSFSTRPVAKCPECGGVSKRKISLSAFHLKGSGWYLTDSKAGSKETALKSKKDDEKPVTKVADDAKSAEASSAAATPGAASASDAAASTTPEKPKVATEKVATTDRSTRKKSPVSRASASRGSRPSGR